MIDNVVLWDGFQNAVLHKRWFMGRCQLVIRYLLTVHELTDTQLDKLDHIHTNAIKAFLGLPPRGPTPAILHSTDGLGFPRISDLYLESHTLAYARCMVKADSRVLHALKSKLNRECLWKRKKTKFGSVCGKTNYNVSKFGTSTRF